MNEDLQYITDGTTAAFLMQTTSLFPQTYGQIYYPFALSREGGWARVTHLPTGCSCGRVYGVLRARRFVQALRALSVSWAFTNPQTAEALTVIAAAKRVPR